MKAVTIALLAFFATAALALDLELSDGRTLKDARIVGSTPIDVMIVYSEGVLNVPLELCPPTVQKRYGYDAESASEYLEERKRREEEAENLQKAQRELLEKRLEERRQSQAVAPERESEFLRLRVVGKVLSVTEEGLLIYTEESPSFLTRYIRPPVKPYRKPGDANPLSISERKRFEEATARWEMHVARSARELVPDVVFLTGYPRQHGVVDNTFIDVYATPSGHYQYKAVSGASKTINRLSYVGATPFIRTAQ